MEEEIQFVPFVIHIAQSDAAWLAAWAPDPRALGAHAMGLAALRGLLAEDMPKDGQPLGGEIQHARALIENARHASTMVRAEDSIGARSRDRAYARIAALEERVSEAERTLVRLNQRDVKDRLEKRIAALEETGYSTRDRLAAHDTLIGIVETAQDIQRNRIAALEAKP